MLEQGVVALGTIVAADPSLAAVMNLEMGAALWMARWVF